VHCDLGDVVAGGSATVTIAYTVPATAALGPASLGASVDSGLVDPIPEDNVATDVTVVVEGPPDTSTDPAASLLTGGSFGRWALLVLLLVGLISLRIVRRDLHAEA
jgi:hypothetical protein